MFASIIGGIGTKLAILAVVTALAGGAYWHYTIVKGERDEALAKVGALAVANEVQRNTIRGQEDAIKNWAKAQAKMQQTLNELAKAQAAANETARKLNDTLSKHDLTALSLAKPGLIERRINGGTAGILRMLRDESSSSRGNSRQNGNQSAK